MNESVMTRVLRQAAVIGFLGVFVTLGVRTLVAQDARLGWGMFTYQINYQLSYEWVLEDGTTRPQQAIDLDGKVRSYIGDSRSRRTRYGRGALRSWLRCYCRHMHRERRPADAIAFRAVASYTVNHGEPQEMIVEYPSRGSAMP